MNKIELKKEILKTARHKQEEVVNDFKTRIKDLKGIEYITQEDQHDLDQQSANQSNMALTAMLTKELNFASHELDILNKMVVPDEVLDTAVIGAVIITDHKTFYPSVSVENFIVKGRDYFGISKQAPLFKEMEGKVKGDMFSFHEFEYRILDIY